VGVVLPNIIGNDALLARLAASESSPAWEREAGGVPDAALEGLLNARRVRRMSDYVKLTLAATTLACRDAGITDTAAFAADWAAARIRSGVWDRAIVGGGEEHGTLVNSAYRHCGLYAAGAGGCAPFGGEAGFVAGAGAVALILESRDSIERRAGGKPRARIVRT